MANLPVGTGDATTQWTTYLRTISTGGGEVMKLLRAQLKIDTGSTREDSSTLWRIWHGR